ncbi:hypothetical protein ACFRMN_04575 [Streptomyces sp. NPDC056835]|uniref:hypothetical protein n=1 Tax=Streptomyces sp. NPDC056835 TaxID=3345956 RepID=UPI0036BD4E72
MVEALLGTGLPEREAAWACWTLVYFVLGLSQESKRLRSRPAMTSPVRSPPDTTPH